METCDVTKRNIGLYKCTKLPQMMKGFIETPYNWSMPKADESSLAAWQAAIFDPVDRIYYFPPLVGVEAANTEAAYEDNAWGILPVHDGQYRMRVFVRQNMCTHKNMFSHRTNNGRIIIIDSLGQMLGTRNEAGDFMGLSLALLHTEKLRINDGAAATKSPIYLALEDNLEVDQYGELIDGKFLKSIIRINDVTMTEISAIATLIVVDVKVACDGTPIVGLVSADFTLLNPDGTTKATTSITESSTVPGRYNIVGTGFVTLSTLTLKTADQLTVDGYEQPERLVITI